MIYQTPHRQKKDCKYRPIKKGTSPLSQIFPSHPVLHWQTNEPGVFKQVALFKQDLCKHSSTSAKRKNDHFRNHILLLHFLSIRLIFFQYDLPIAHSLPSHPGRQLQVYRPTLFIISQTPPFRQGLLIHQSSM